jgi:VCBS repeat-containing protein
MSISNFEDLQYTEQQGTVQLTTHGMFANGVNYGSGFVRFAVSDHADSGDYLKLISAADPNANGAVSISDDGVNVYLGNGTGKVQIGSIGPSNDGQAGRPLKIDFLNVTIPGTSPVTNGDFSQGLTGWTSVLTAVDLGVTKIAGWATPEAPLIKYPGTTPGGNDNDLVSGFDAPHVEVNGGRLLLEETNMLSSSYGVVHGPAAYSDVFHADAGMVLKFDWAANRVNDDYHVVGYLLNSDTGAITLALQGWGATGSGVASVAVPADGNYRFVFVSGTFDATGGTVLGASMYIDNIRVEAGAITDAVLDALSHQVVYENRSDAPAASKTVTVTAMNTTGTVSSDDLLINVTQVNDAPVKSAVVGLANGTEDIAYTVGAASLTAGFTDPDHDVLSASNLTANHGTVVANADGSYTITQPANYNGTVTLSYDVVDGHGGVIAATKSFVINPVNDAPVALADSGAATEDGGAVLVDVLANDTDVDSGDVQLLVSVDGTGATGSVSIVNGKIAYDPGAHFQNLGAGATATDTFSYTMRDAAGAQSTATVTMTVTGVNDAPVANADTASTSQDNAVVVAVLANDTDVDAGDTQALVSVDLTATVGAVQIVDGKVSYDPGTHFQSLAAGATATDTFSYVMKDSGGIERSATVTVTITGVNDAPVAMADTGNAVEDGAAVVVNVLANDTDVDTGDTQTLVSLNTTGTVGAASIVDGKVAYDPGSHFQSLGAGATAVDTFSYTMKDSGGIERSATVTMTVTGVNDAPVAIADTGKAIEDGGVVVVDVLANDTDIDAGDTKALVSTDTTGTIGAVSIVDGKLAYDPGAHFQSLGVGATAVDTFSYTMKDSGGVERSATVTMTVTGVNDAPVAHTDTASVFEKQSVTIDVLANDTDVDAGDTKAIVSADHVSALGGTVTVVNGALQYTANADTFDLLTAGQSVTDTLSYTMKDASGAMSTSTVSVTVMGAADGANIIGTVHFDTGSTALVGTGLDEAIYGSNGDDQMFGMGGSDHLYGMNGEDTLNGGTGIDFLDGGNGKDVLIGGKGSDFLTGGLGNDLFVFDTDSASTDVDVITDFKVGNDALQLLHGLTITSMTKVDFNHDGVFDTELLLSNGSHIELLGVSNLKSPAVLF